MIDKIVKEYERIYSSISKSKKLIVADIDRIDEKYRKLAQEEKKSLTENLAILNEQLKYYESMLGKNAVVEDTTVEEPKEEEEEKIQDTIFPENNEESEEEKKEAEDEKISEDLNNAIEEEKQEIVEQEASATEPESQFEESNTQEEGDPNQWPVYEEVEKAPAQTTTDDWGDIDDWK